MFRKRAHSCHRVDNTFRREPPHSTYLRNCFDFARETLHLKGYQEFEGNNAKRLLRNRELFSYRPKYAKGPTTLLNRPATGIDVALGTNGCGGRYEDARRPLKNQAQLDVHPHKKETSDQPEKWEQIRREVEDRRLRTRQEEAKMAEQALVSTKTIDVVRNEENEANFSLYRNKKRMRTAKLCEKLEVEV